VGSTPAGRTTTLSPASKQVVRTAPKQSRRSQTAQKPSYHPSYHPKSCARDSRPRTLVSIEECLYQDSVSGIIQAVVKQAEHGKQVQHRRSLRTGDLAEARLRLYAFRLELAGRKLPPPSPPEELPPIAPPLPTPPSPPPNHPLAGLNFEKLGEKWLATLVDIGQKTRERRRYSIRVVGKAMSERLDRTLLNLSRMSRYLGDSGRPVLM